jgi:HAMP domain-containing protein
MKESIKVQAVTIKKPIDENLLRKTQAATIIAQSLHYNDISGKTPEQVINSALEEAGELTKEQIETVQEMLKLAEEVGLTYNKDFVPVFIEPEINPVVVEEKKPEENDGWSEEDLESMANTVDDWDDIVDLYGPGELHIVDTDTGETVDDLKEELKEETLNEVLSRVERIRAKMRFHKSAAKRERKLKVALHKHSDSSTINHRARTMAIKLMKQKLAKKPLSQMSVAEKERVEKIIAKRGAVVNRMAMKLTQRIRTIEKQRLSR